jgi:nucleoside 2-deoxyribosyltransferase
VLKLAERTILSSDVFVVMPFEDKGHLRDAYNAFRRVCKEKNFSAMKVDHHLDGHARIVPQIFSKIKHSAFVIAELSGARPNVYYELGYARALGKAVIQTAYQGTDLPFDVFDVPTHFWDSQDVLERKLALAIDQLTSSFGQYS